jgi:hypothetical protein
MLAGGVAVGVVLPLSQFCVHTLNFRADTAAM